MIKLTVIVLGLLVTSCSSLKNYYRSGVIDIGDMKSKYSIWSNNQVMYQPFVIQAQIWFGKKITYTYWFFGSTDFVQKAENHRGKGKVGFYLIFDSTYKYQQNHWDSLIVSHSIDKNIELPISKIDSIVFKKVISISDSLNLKSFHYLKRAISFRVVSAKKMYR
jgi:hypothetical protein